MAHGRISRFRLIRTHEAVLLAAALAVGLFAATLGSAQMRPAIASSETQFVERSASGINIVPASCPSDPHYSGECSIVTPTPTPNPTPTPTPTPTPPPSSSCPAGQHMNGTDTTCYCDGTNQLPVGGSCFICPSGQHAVGQLCICDDTNLPPNTAGQCTQQVCPSGWQWDPSTNQCVRIAQCGAPPVCSDSTHVLNQCTGATTNCAASGSGWRCVSGACVPPPQPIASISAVPSLVPPNRTTNVAWSSQNTVSCVVSGNNGDSGAGWSGTNGIRTSSPIQNQTTYTLVCTGTNGETITRNATVTIIPDWTEDQGGHQ